ncbi:helix-turn-helix domain-containing protein [Methylobacterium sp. E-045]|uniref:helix-turn-helix domain-containing protein n=1 Tax=Methylobacterium sp. E-045 TaxID=2836575 RepID=UPI001FB9507F|nr:helix-turn-helix domain-containing protein [Methylobacterium sp. E-045]MCJ2129194.1 helix-turn-helix domain-containing protein [Methylobacterium sp. E-045]
MREEQIDDDAFAALIGDCTGHAVKKWKYGEREPDAGTMMKIEDLTEGKVTVRDWAEQAAERNRRRQSRIDAASEASAA